MTAPAARSDDAAMDDEHELARLRDEEDRNRFAVRRAEERMERLEHELEERLSTLGEAEARAERSIEEELRREHWGRPERSPSWRRPHRG
jgi:hypothetical protein